MNEPSKKLGDFILASTDDQVRLVKSAIEAWPEGDGVYFAVAYDRVKIGKADNVARRLREIGTSCPFPLSLVLVLEPGTMKVERYFHRLFRASRAHGEWFYMSEELVEFILEVQKMRREGLPPTAVAE